MIGEGDDSRRRRLSVFRGLPWGSDGFRGGRKVTEAVEDFLWIAEGRSLSFESCREPRRPSSEMDVKVVVLTSVDTGANVMVFPSSFWSPSTPDSVEKYSADTEGTLVPGDTSESGLLASEDGGEVSRATSSRFMAIVGRNCCRVVALPGVWDAGAQIAGYPARTSTDFEEGGCVGSNGLYGKFVVLVGQAWVDQQVDVRKMMP